jgi:hypothetical protein
MDWQGEILGIIELSSILRVSTSTNSSINWGELRCDLNPIIIFSPPEKILPCFIHRTTLNGGHAPQYIIERRFNLVCGFLRKQKFEPKSHY